MIDSTAKTTTIAALVALLLFAAVAIGLAGPADASRWDQRLQSLHPKDPMAYFELAEDVADEATTDRELMLARRLYALAGLLDARYLGRSAWLALADLSEDPLEKRRLLALAGLLIPPADPGGFQPWRTAGAVDAAGATGVVAFAEALSYYRRGRGSRALAALREQGAADLLTRYAFYLPGGERRFREDCKGYRDGTRPHLAPAELSRMLRLEAALLAGADRSWSADLLISEGQPLVEVDPQRLDEAFGFDLARPYYRDGQWVSAPGPAAGG